MKLDFCHSTVHTKISAERIATWRKHHFTDNSYQHTSSLHSHLFSYMHACVGWGNVMMWLTSNGCNMALISMGFVTCPWVRYYVFSQGQSQREYIKLHKVLWITYTLHAMIQMCWHFWKEHHSCHGALMCPRVHGYTLARKAPHNVHGVCLVYMRFVCSVAVPFKFPHSVVLCELYHLWTCTAGSYKVCSNATGNVPPTPDNGRSGRRYK